MEEAKIEELFKTCKETFDAKFEQFKRVFFPQNLTKMEEMALPSNDDTITPKMEDLLNDDEITAKRNEPGF